MEDNMKKIPITLIFVLICSAFIMSCEYATNVMQPVGHGTDPEDPPEMTDPGEKEGMLKGSPVVINELMADNDNIAMDPQGDNDDWIELFNRTDSPVDLTGMYLSDKVDNPTKWQFPDGTEIAANGYLIVWCDEDHDDEAATEGLHSNFKLSKSGETVLLVGPDANDNMVLDTVVFGEQETDVAYGRIPNGTGDFQIVAATPSAENTVN